MIDSYDDEDIFNSLFPLPTPTVPAPIGITINLGPLLINTPGSWCARPHAKTGIEKLFLAADYVQTYADLATMEGADEAPAAQ